MYSRPSELYNSTHLANTPLFSFAPPKTTGGYFGIPFFEMRTNLAAATGSLLDGLGDAGTTRSSKMLGIT